MEEQTPPQTEGGQTATSGETTTETDWQYVAELIAAEIAKKQSTYEVIEANEGNETGEFRVIHEVTLGDLAVSALLFLLISMQLLRWFFKVVWRR